MQGENAYSCEACARHAKEAQEGRAAAAAPADAPADDADADATEAAVASDATAASSEEEEAAEELDRYGNAISVRPNGKEEKEKEEKPAQQPAVKILQLVQPPAVLTVHLKRFAVSGRSTKKLDSAVPYTLELELQPYPYPYS